MSQILFCSNCIDKGLGRAMSPAEAEIHFAANPTHVRVPPLDQESEGNDKGDE